MSNLTVNSLKVSNLRTVDRHLRYPGKLRSCETLNPRWKRPNAALQRLKPKYEKLTIICFQIWLLLANHAPIARRRNERQTRAPSARRSAKRANRQGLPDVGSMTKCVKPLRHLVRLGAMSSRSTNQNAPFGRLRATCCSVFKWFRALRHNAHRMP
jgi:hypothetical protein